MRYQIVPEKPLASAMVSSQIRNDLFRFNLMIKINIFLLFGAFACTLNRHIISSLTEYYLLWDKKSKAEEDK